LSVPCPQVAKGGRNTCQLRSDRSSRPRSMDYSGDHDPQQSEQKWIPKAEREETMIATRQDLERLSESLPPLTANEASVEANRCLYCYDAPCTHACPTHIDIPRFIKKISTNNLTGSAETIFESNLLGATCARVCPVQELCEGACVLGKEHNPIAIGRLQRHAMDFARDHNRYQLRSHHPLGVPSQ